MNGMAEVLALRRSGVKPAAVFVDLVAMAKPDRYAMSRSGIVTVDIGRAESLADVDFRPLVGLQVFVSDIAGDIARHRRCAALIAAINPRHLVMPIWRGEKLTVHQRWAGTPVRTESYSV